MYIGSAKDPDERLVENRESLEVAVLSVPRTRHHTIPTIRTSDESMAEHQRDLPQKTGKTDEKSEAHISAQSTGTSSR